MQRGNEESSIDTKKIQQLYRDIMEQITIYDKNIREANRFTSTHSIDTWQDKKNVLDVARLCFLGEKNLQNLEDEKNKNPLYGEGWSFTKEFLCKTDALMRDIETTLQQYDIQFIKSCVIDYLQLLPKDLIVLIQSNYLDNMADVVNVASTTKYYYSLFKENPSTMLRPLLNYAAFGEWDAAREIWKKNPAMFLTSKGSVCHPDCYPYKERTAYQIAWMNAEHDIVIEMGQDFDKEEQKKQYQEIFPEGKPIKYDCDLEKAKALLQNVYDAVRVDNLFRPDLWWFNDNLDKMKDTTRNTLQALYDFLNPENFNGQEGLVFDERIYLEALMFSSKKKIWLIRVEGWIAKCLPTGYLRPYCQGVFKILERRENLSGAGFSSLHPRPDWRLGRHFYLDGRGDVVSQFSRITKTNCPAGGKTWQEYIQLNEHKRQIAISNIFSNSSTPQL